MDLKKYKLVNSTTKEETICDKIVVDGFDYYVSDEKINVNNYYLTFINETVVGDLRKCEDSSYSFTHCKKVLATNNPNSDVPKVLPINHCECNLTLYPDQKEICNDICDNKYQETYTFTEQDMINFVEWYETSQEVYEFWRKNRVNMDMNNSHNIKIKENIRKLISIWKKQQPKTVYYE